MEDNYITEADAMSDGADWLDDDEYIEILEIQQLRDYELMDIAKKCIDTKAYNKGFLKLSKKIMDDYNKSLFVLSFKQRKVLYGLVRGNKSLNELLQVATFERVAAHNEDERWELEKFMRV
jgi:hypothetical protein